jgi:hypothetical protein
MFRDFIVREGDRDLPPPSLRDEACHDRRLLRSVDRDVSLLFVLVILVSACSLL